VGLGGGSASVVLAPERERAAVAWRKQGLRWVSLAPLLAFLATLCFEGRLPLG
jgi:hypothetical protein